MVVMEEVQVFLLTADMVALEVMPIPQLAQLMVKVRTQQ